MGGVRTCKERVTRLNHRPREEKAASTERENEKLVDVKATHIDEVVAEEEYAESHYMRPHWARVTTKTPVRIGDVK